MDNENQEREEAMPIASSKPARDAHGHFVGSGKKSRSRPARKQVEEQEYEVQEEAPRKSYFQHIGERAMVSYGFNFMQPSEEIEVVEVESDGDEYESPVRYLPGF